MSEESFVEAVKAAHPDQVESAEIKRTKRVSVVVKRSGFLMVAESLRNDFGYTHPVAAGGVDYPREEKIQMIYYLLNPETGIILNYVVDLPRDDLSLPSLTKVWEAISFHERETYEMFGIYFEGHDNLIPLLLPPGWTATGKGYPLRKDFKLGGA